MTKRLFKFISILIILFSISSLSFAQMRIAVIDFQADNISKSTANMVSELIRTEMINTGKFVVIERAQMDEILKEQGFQQSGCTDVSCAVQIGKMLSARKMLVGTVMKLGTRIIINGRIVDVEKGVGEFGEKQDAKSESDLYDAVSEFVKNLTRRIGVEARVEPKKEVKKEEEKPKIVLPPIEVPKYGITLSGAYLMAQGDFTKVSDTGYGCNLSFNMNYNKFVLMISAGYYIFDTVEDWIDSVNTIAFAGYGGYSIPLTRRIRMVPELGLGYMAHIVSHDERGRRLANDYEFTTDYYFDPLTSVRLEFDYLINSSFQIVLAPVYTFFFEKNSTNQILGGEIGVKYCF